MMKTTFVNIPSYIEDSNYRYKMPKPQLKIEGRGNGIKTNIINLHEIAKALKCHDQYPLKYLGFELGSQTSYKYKNDNDVTCIINGAFKDEEIRKMLDKFIEKYILCQKCKYPEMYMKIKGGRIIYGQCDSCGHVSDLDNANRLASYILKNPPGDNLSIKNVEEVQILQDIKEDKKLSQKKQKVTAQEAIIGSELLQQFLEVLKQTYKKLLINDSIDLGMAELMLTADIQKFNLERNLKDRVCYLLFQCMFDDAPLDQFPQTLERNYEFLMNNFNDLDSELAQCHLILNIQQLLQNRKIEDKYFCTILKHFYDYSYLEDQYLINWFDQNENWQNDLKQDFIYNKDIDDHYRQLSEPMINWLKSSLQEEEGVDAEEQEEQQIE